AWHHREPLGGGESRDPREPRDECSAVRVDEVPYRVADGDGRDHCPSHQRCMAAEPAWCGRSRTAQLADGRSRSCPDSALLYWSVSCVLGRHDTCGLVGTYVRVADTEVVEDGCWNDGHPSEAGVEPSPPPLQPPHHPMSGGQTVGATSAEHHGIDAADGLVGLEEARFTRPGRGPEHAARGHAAVLGSEDHGTARSCGRFRPMANGQPSYGRECRVVENG